MTRVYYTLKIAIMAALAVSMAHIANDITRIADFLVGTGM